MSLAANRARRLATISSLALALGAGLATLPTLAFAQTQQAAGSQHDIDLPAGPLETSLVRLADLSGVQLVYSAQVSSGVRAPAVRGRMDAATAFSRVLAGSGLTYRFVDARTVTVERAPQAVEDDGSRVLGPVRVEGAQPSTFDYSGGPVRGDGIAQLGGVRGGQDDEATGYRANVATIATGAPTAIEDIPRSISVLTQEQIRQQDVQDIGDALERLPGVSLVESNRTGLGSGAQVVSRGFDITRVQIDGGSSRPLNIQGNGMLDLAGYERLELVRGPNAIFAGAGSQGGSLNLVRKRPGAIDSFEMTGILGTFERKAATVDVSTPSLGGSSIAFRGVASLSDQEFFYANGARRNALLYGILDAPLGDRARLELGFQRSKVEETAPYSGLRRYLDGPIIDFGDYYYNLSPTWSYEHANRIEGFARLYAELTDDIDIEVGVDAETGDQRRSALSTITNFIENGGASLYSPVGADYAEMDTNNLAFDFKLTGKHRFWALDHNFLVAGEFSESDRIQEISTSTSNTLFPADVDEYLAAVRQYQPIYYPYLGRFGVGGSTVRSGLVLSDVISWRDFIDLSLSVRGYKSDASSFSVSRDVEAGGATDVQIGEAEDGRQSAEVRWVPAWAIAVKPWKNFTFYGTRAEGQSEVPVPRYTADGAILGPSSYENLEGGVKFATDRWLATAAYYSLTEDNVPQPIFGTACPPSDSTASPCYEAQGATVESRGVDVEITGEILSGLSINANYNWNHRETTATGQNFLTQAPVSAGQIFLDWKPDFWPNTSLRGGLRYRGEVSATGRRLVFDPVTLNVLFEGEIKFDEDAYTVFDLGVQHQLTPNVLLDLFVENLTDEEYLSTISPEGSNFPGARRTFTATVRWKSQGRVRTNARSGDLAPFGDASDWYAAADFGAHSLADLDTRASGLSQDGVTPIDWTFETKDGAFGTARIGYRLSSAIRAEIEGSYRSSQIGDIGEGNAAPFGVCGASYADKGVPFDCDGALGSSDAWSLIGNALYDFGADDARLRPFIGLGLGVAKTSVGFSGKLEGIGGAAPWNGDSTRKLQEAIGAETSNVGFAYQLLAGLSFKVGPQATLEATYRYYNVPEVKWDSFNLGEPGGYPQYDDVIPNLTGRVGSFSSAFEDHSLTVGFRWAFGVR